MKNPVNSPGMRVPLASGELVRQEPEVLQAIEREAARQEEEARRLRGRTMPALEQHAQWQMLSQLPMRLTAGIPLPHFRVKDLLALKSGQLIESTWASTDDVPLKIGALLFSWSEFEVVEQRMAARLTRLA